MRKDPIIWAAIPTAADFVERLPCKLLLYQVSDKYDANEDSAVAKDTICKLHERLKERAAIVLYSGRRLFAEATEPHRYFLEQAVDFDHFAKEDTLPVSEMELCQHPILGYFGAMDYVMDVELIAEVARRRPEWHWVMIGNQSNLVRIKEANVHFLGPRPYADLPRYVRYFDVCVLPWKLDNIFVGYGSAIKVREYLATGKPVVIAPLYEFAETPGVRRFHSVDEFIRQVEDSLQNGSSKDRQIRQDAVRGCTWDVRAFEVGKLIAKLLERQVTGAGMVRFSFDSGVESVDHAR
jgi:glycosyltransferase involved in cell wall biosynthesis